MSKLITTPELSALFAMEVMMMSSTVIALRRVFSPATTAFLNAALAACPSALVESNCAARTPVNVIVASNFTGASVGAAVGAVGAAVGTAVGVEFEELFGARLSELIKS